MNSQTLKEIECRVIDMLSSIDTGEEVDFYTRLKAVEKQLVSLAGFLRGVHTAAEEISGYMKEDKLQERRSLPYDSFGDYSK